MQTDLIIITEYCRKSQIDPTFLSLLEDYGLLDIHNMDGERYIYISQLPRLEQYSRLYYDLSINMEGIDAIHHLLDRINGLQNELHRMRSRLRLYETDDD